MLVWIKAPCVASGVLASFVLLLSTVVSDQVIPDDLELTTPIDRSTHTDIPIRTLPFAQGLTNPCSWAEGTDTSPDINLGDQAAEFAQEYFTYVSHYAVYYREEAEEMLKTHNTTDCISLEMQKLPYSPSVEELQELTVDEALNKVYVSLLMHAAYSFFIHHQFATSDIRCANTFAEEASLADMSLKMAYKQKALACYIRVGMVLLKYQYNDTLPFLDDSISDLTMCSRRHLRDCQVMKSVYALLGVVQDYASGVLRSTTAIPSVTEDGR